MVRPQTAQKISSSANRAESATWLLKLTATPSAPPASAVAIPIREPPTAVAKNTAGKYGVKNTSGRIWARPHRATVAKARQQAAKPMLKSGEGWEIPCQPCLNSSINFFIVMYTMISESKIRPSVGIPGFHRERQSIRRTIAMDKFALSAQQTTIQGTTKIWGNDMGRLDGKVAVITGATSGIGLRTAEVFVADGAKIVIAGRRAPKGEALAKKLGDNCVFRQTDVTEEAQMQALIGLSIENSAASTVCSTTPAARRRPAASKASTWRGSTRRWRRWSAA